jgi:hypothetical protein
MCRSKNHATEICNSLGPDVTSDSKKPGKTGVLYHYCGLSRFFFESDFRMKIKYGIIQE